jgi:hypothetical protein
LAEKALSQRDEVERRSAHALERKADALHEKLSGKLDRAIGAKKVSALMDAMTRERRELRQRIKASGNVGRDTTRDRAASLRRLAALAKKLGVNPDTSAKLIREYVDQLRQLAEPAYTGTPGRPVASNYDKWRALTPFHKFPLPWGVEPPPLDPNDPHRWFLYQPPFFGFLFDYWQWCKGGFRADYELFLNPPPGLSGPVTCWPIFGPFDSWDDGSRALRGSHEEDAV